MKGKKGWLKIHILKDNQTLGMNNGNTKYVEILTGQLLTSDDGS